MSHLQALRGGAGWKSFDGQGPCTLRYAGSVRRAVSKVTGVGEAWAAWLAWHWQGAGV